MVDNRGVAYVALSSADRVRFTVHTYSGQKILENHELTVDLRYLKAGSYIINAVINDFERVNSKVIKN